MSSATLAFPSLVASSTSISCYRNYRLPRIQALVSSYPLARKIMVRNLPFSTSEDFLQKKFSAFGEIAEDIAKQGKHDFQQQLRTSGPSENLQVPEEPANNEVADCW